MSKESATGLVPDDALIWDEQLGQLYITSATCDPDVRPKRWGRLRLSATPRGGRDSDRVALGTAPVGDRVALPLPEAPGAYDIGVRLQAADVPVVVSALVNGRLVFRAGLWPRETVHFPLETLSLDQPTPADTATISSRVTLELLDESGDRRVPEKMHGWAYWQQAAGRVRGVLRFGREVMDLQGDVQDADPPAGTAELRLRATGPLEGAPAQLRLAVAPAGNRLEGAFAGSFVDQRSLFVGNAVFHATGWRPMEMPLRPDRVLAGVGG